MTDKLGPWEPWPGKEKPENVTGWMVRFADGEERKIKAEGYPKEQWNHSGEEEQFHITHVRRPLQSGGWNEGAPEGYETQIVNGKVLWREKPEPLWEVRGANIRHSQSGLVLYLDYDPNRKSYSVEEVAALMNKAEGMSDE